jgi:hypothetical protein
VRNFFSVIISLIVLTKSKKPKHLAVQYIFYMEVTIPGTPGISLDRRTLLFIFMPFYNIIWGRST